MLHYVLNIAQIYLHGNRLFIIHKKPGEDIVIIFIFPDEKSNQVMVKSFTKGVASGF